MKTVKAQKGVFRCKLPRVPQDNAVWAAHTTYTEITEEFLNGRVGFGLVETSIIEATCVIRFDDAKVLSCSTGKVISP